MPKGRRHKKKRGAGSLLCLMLLPIVFVIVLYMQYPDSFPDATMHLARRRYRRLALSNTVEPFLSNATIAVPGCKDRLDKCSAWAKHAECESNPGFMLRSCAFSCGGCFVKPVRETVALTSTRSMPTIGFGTAALGNETYDVVLQALEVGYRRLDTAQAREWYREDLVGQAISASGIPREEIFITTKVHPRDFGVEPTTAAMRKSLVDLNTSYVDLVLLHYSECWGDLCAGKTPSGTWKDSWHALETLVDKGTIKTLGVSNFQSDALNQLWKEARIKPVLVQMNSDPMNQNTAVQAYCRLKGIQFEGYSSLGSQYLNSGEHKENPILTHPTIADIAAYAGRSTAQVVLRWAVQSGQSVVPRSSNAQHMADNLDIFDFELSVADMERIAQLDQA